MERTLEFYKTYLNLSKKILGLDVTGEQVSQFLESPKCSNGEKHAYYRALKLSTTDYTPEKSEFNLHNQNNPILCVDAAIVEKQILPSLTSEQVLHLIDKAENVRV